MFVTEHLEGRIQCVDGDFVCINIHLKSSEPESRLFIDQIYINPKSDLWICPDFSFSLNTGIHYDSGYLSGELKEIINQYLSMRKDLHLDDTDDTIESS